MKKISLSLLVGLILYLCQPALAQSSIPPLNPADSVGYVNSTSGTVIKVGEYFCITPNNEEGARYFAGNLDDRFKEDGMQIIFSGVRLRIPPNVRMIGTPISLRSVEMVRNPIGQVSPTAPGRKKAGLQPGKRSGGMVKANSPSNRSLPKASANNKQSSRGNVAATKTRGMATIPTRVQGLNITGTVQTISNVFVIVTDDERRFVPANLPAQFQRNGIKIAFAGEEGPIPPNVRLIGVPFIISGIQKLSGGE